MNERIYNVRTFLKLTQKEFATKIGLSHGSLSDIENGKTSITERTIILICSTFNVNETWLRFGKGDMFNNIDVKFNAFFEVYNNLNPILQDFLFDVANDLLKAQDKL